MIVRQATLLDLLSLAPLGQLYAEEAQGHQNYPFDLEHCLSNAALTIVDEDGCFLVAFDGDDPVGFLWGSARVLPWSKAKLAFDTILYVKPEKRKSSVGYKLMRAWEEWAKEHNAVEVQISIASGIHEEQSISFFKKLGYSYIGQQLRKEC
ncbi:putative acetyltransferase (endogenous virus) [Gutovirus Vc1]|uniref:Putative acetyltransferase n=1 Tax=Vibrio phage Vc1 TaxID=1480731 RepID=X2L0B0_9CAUD|nr:acetyltransferase [Vibrio phage Vc1]AHN84654.1 putative acetyltransferase [Vibrio phage Vc1]